MSRGNADRIIQEYLDQVSAELSDLPAEDRNEILSDLRVHIEEAVGDSAVASEADVRNTLQRLGEPGELAREARLRVDNDRAPETEPVDRRLDKTPTALEVAAIILSGLVWPIGVLLVWISPRWLTRDKIIATLVPATGTLIVVALLVGGLMAWEPGVSESVSVDQNTFTEENSQSGSSEVDERSPRSVSESGDNISPWARLIVVFGFIGGAVASPFVTAVYLAIRIQPVEVRVYPDGRQFRGGVPAGGQA